MTTWLTQTQAADRIGVHRRTMYRYVKAGRLGFSVNPVTGHPRIAIGDLDAFQAANYKPAKYSRRRTPLPDNAEQVAA